MVGHELPRFPSLLQFQSNARVVVGSGVVPGYKKFQYAERKQQWRVQEVARMGSLRCSIRVRWEEYAARCIWACRSHTRKKPSGHKSCRVCFTGRGNHATFAYPEIAIGCNIVLKKRSCVYAKPLGSSLSP